jgi:hypothetical protein
MKTNKKTLALASLFLAALMFFSATTIAGAVPVTPTPFREVDSLSDNGYKYPSVASSVISALYQEWWYFEVTDFENGLFFTCWYEIDNPAGETLDDMEVPRAAYIGCEGFYGETLFSGGNIGEGINYTYTADTDDWNVNIGGNTMIATTLDTVHLAGYEVITGISWDLSLTRQDLTGTYTDSVPTGYSETDIMGWCCMMPLAVATGTITINDTVVDVNAQGYADHNWGSPEIIVYAPWIKVVTEDLAIIGAGVPAMKAPNKAWNGFINVWVQDQWVWFKVPKIHYTWAVDPATGLQYVSTFKITATSIDNKWKVDIASDLAGSYFYEFVDLGPYIIAFYKSFEFITTGTIRHLVFPDVLFPVNVELPTTIEQTFIIPTA